MKVEDPNRFGQSEETLAILRASREEWLRNQVAKA